MPGIFGLFSQRPAAECARVVQTMAAHMNGAASDRASQLFSSELGVYAMSFAHAGSFALRESNTALATEGAGAGGTVTTARLLFTGESFDSVSTPGPLLSRYESDPDSFVESLNGSFSGLLVDTARGRALLFNDRYGSERLYFHQRGEDFYFASEAKALLAVLPSLRHFDREGLDDFLRYGSVQQGRSLFHGVRLLPAGSLWSFRRDGRCSKACYFTASSWEQQTTLSAPEYQAAFQRTFAERLPAYFGSGQSIGISLTGGLDTRMIMAWLREQIPRPVCYTYAGQHGQTRDVELAGRIASLCGLEHHTLRIETDFLRDFPRYLDRTVATTDGCAGAMATHELYLSAKAAKLAPVRMTGNFGSEILRAMSTLKPIGLMPDLLQPDLLARLRSAPVDPPSHPVTYAAFAEIPWHLFGPMAAARSLLTFRSPYLDNALVQLAYRSPPELRRSATPALRLVHRLDPAIARIPTDRAVLLNGGVLQALKRAAAEITFKLDYYDTEGLPRALSGLAPVLRLLQRTALLGQHKFLPYRSWFRNELANHVSAVMTDSRTRQAGCWNPLALERMTQDHLAGRHNHTREIHAVLTLESIQRQFQLGAPR